jgi:hypothetical protein
MQTLSVTPCFSISPVGGLNLDTPGVSSAADTPPAHVIAQALVRCDLDGLELEQRDVVIESGDVIELGRVSHDSGPLATSRTELCTADVSIMKRWVGLSNARAQTMPGKVWTLDPEDLPTVEACLDRERFSESECGALDRLLRAYLWGNSEPLERYKSLLENFRVYRGQQYPQFGTRFAASAWVLGRVTIQPGGVLRLTGPEPAVLIANRLDIHSGGTLDLKTSSYITVGTMRKLESQTENSHE